MRFKRWGQSASSRILRGNRLACQLSSQGSFRTSLGARWQFSRVSVPGKCRLAWSPAYARVGKSLQQPAPARLPRPKGLIACCIRTPSRSCCAKAGAICVHSRPQCWREKARARARQPDGPSTAVSSMIALWGRWKQHVLSTKEDMLLARMVNPVGSVDRPSHPHGANAIHRLRLTMRA